MIYTVTLNAALDLEFTVADMRTEALLRATSVRRDFGGKGINVSRALAALDCKSCSTGFVGGATGAWIEASLADAGIATDFIETVEETRTNISIANYDYTQMIKVNGPGAAVSEAECTALIDKIGVLASEEDWWVLSGSHPPGISQNIYQTLACTVRAAGGRVVLDAEGEALHQGLLARPFLVKPNRSEASAFLGRHIETVQDALAAVGAFCELGVALVVLSLDQDGALLSDGRTTWYAPAPQVAEGNPTGAGDALLAGTIWALTRGFALPDVLRWGVACGSATAEQAGSAVAPFAASKDLWQRVQIERLV